MPVAAYRPLAPPVPVWRQLRQAGRTSPYEILALFGIERPPVDVYGIAAGLGIAVQTVPLDHAGEVHPTGSPALISVRGTDVPWRRRFTVAHELGHLMLHDFGVSHRDTTFEGGPRETEANRFAAELLMPARMVALVLGGPRQNISIQSVAALFDVSALAMEYRLKNLGFL